MNSTFRSDGYRDAVNGCKPLPPLAFERGHMMTVVYRDEYMEGYRAGQNYLRNGRDYDGDRSAPFNHNLVR